MSKPVFSDPFSLSDALVEEVCALRPIEATFYGIGGYDHLWGDLSPAGSELFAARLSEWRERVKGLPRQEGRWASLAVRVLLDWLDGEIGAVEEREHLVDLNTIASRFQMVSMVFDSMDRSTAAGWENVAARLEGIGEALGGYRQALETGMLAGETVSVRQVRGAVKQGRIHAGEGSFFRRLPAELAGSGLGDAGLARRIEEGVRGACEAYSALSDWLESAYLPAARAEDGVGRARYLRAMRRWLGASPDPEETYAWGWTEVRRVLGEATRVAGEIAPGKTLSEVYEALRTDPERTAPDRASLLSIMAERQQRALKELDGVHFVVPEVIRRIDVREAPPGGPIGAYYLPPSEDFSRAGTVFYSMHGEGPFSLYDQVSTAYHEGFPGHHLQCGIQVSLRENLSRLHRVVYNCSAYSEGWALYAEKLMGELGYYEKPEYELGRLANELARACRVVIDIGAHLGLSIPQDAPFHPGGRWTYEIAAEMMRELGGLSPERAESEVTRYFGWPGQAISYKVGEREILALREKARGAGVPLSEFHRRVLACGNLGLDLLREEMG
ncbi:MAG: DUF885 domain-containing protein [Polyangiaceae bacterium]